VRRCTEGGRRVLRAPGMKNGGEAAPVTKHHDIRAERGSVRVIHVRQVKGHVPNEMSLILCLGLGVGLTSALRKNVLLYRLVAAAKKILQEMKKKNSGPEADLYRHNQVLKSSLNSTVRNPCLSSFTHLF
jgi:hypothetical protein